MKTKTRLLSVLMLLHACGGSERDAPVLAPASTKRSGGTPSEAATPIMVAGPRFAVAPVRNTAGGRIDGRLMGEGCVGNFPSTPQHTVIVGAPLPVLSVLVTSGADTTIAVRGPDGMFRCNDDAVRLDSALSFVNAQPGTYEIFVGLYQSRSEGYQLSLSDQLLGEAANVAAHRPTVSDAIADVLAGLHGLSSRSGYDPMSLVVLKEEPAAAARELERGIGELQALPGEPDAVTLFERTVGLLGYLSSREADQLLVSWYVRLEAHRATSREQVNQEFRRLSYQVLSSLGERFYQPVVDSILENWNAMTTDERRIRLIYVCNAARGQRDVADQLRSMVQDEPPDRELLERTIAYIQAP